MRRLNEIDRKKKKGERGQAFVESGLIMLIFIPVLVGIMDFGQFLYLHQSLSERVRAATRYGAVHSYPDGSDMVKVAMYNDPAGSGTSTMLPNLQNTNSAGDGYVSATLSGAGTDEAFVTVTIRNYPYNFIWMPNSLTKRTITDTEPYEI